MINWEKPIHWVDDSKPTHVLKINKDGSAWVYAPARRCAYLFDSSGKSPGIVSVENTSQSEEIMEKVIDWNSPIQISGGDFAEVVAREGDGAWVTWGSRSYAYLFDKYGDSKATSTKMDNTPPHTIAFARIDHPGFGDAITRSPFSTATHKIIIKRGCTPVIQKI